MTRGHLMIGLVVATLGIALSAILFGGDGAGPAPPPQATVSGYILPTPTERPTSAPTPAPSPTSPLTPIPTLTPAPLPSPQPQTAPLPLPAPTIAPGVVSDAILAVWTPAVGEAIAAEAVRVADCESRLRPDAVNGHHYGLFQISAPIHAWKFPDFWTAWSDPVRNAEMALYIFNQNGGWGPWSCRFAAFNIPVTAGT